MVEIIKLVSDQPEEAEKKRVLSVIRRGGVIAYPTDTFYGLGCDPFNEASIERLFTVKQRERDKPILLIISEPSRVDQLTREKGRWFEKVSSQFWPGPLTMVLQASEHLPPSLLGGMDRIGIRLPAHELCRQIVQASGGVLTGTSANLSGSPNAATAEEVMSQVGRWLDLIIDGGPTPGGAPSTVLDVTHDPPRIIRDGAVAREALEAFFAL